jgi:transketolase
VLDQTKFGSAANLVKGAYVVTGAAAPDVILIGTGSEVGIALKAYEALAADGIRGRVVSMPSWELFERQPAAYKESVLPSSVTARVAVEAGVRNGWERYLGDRGIFIGMSSFGASAPEEVLYNKFGITFEAVIAAARKVLA